MPQTPKKTEQTNRRILILGSARHTRLVKAYEWDSLPPKLNVSDYDTVILNLEPFQNREYANGINVDLIPVWSQFARLIFSRESEIVAIGSPEFALGANPYLPPTWWLPVELTFVHETGQEIREVEAEFSFYFDLVRSWSFYLEGVRPKGSDFTKAYVATGAPGADSIRQSVSALAGTRFQRAIGFKISFVALDTRNSPFDSQVGESGDVFWLPAPTETSTVDGIDVILREKYGLRFEKTPPKWIGAFQLPAQLPLQEAVQEKESAIADLRKQLEADRLALAQTSRFLQLLYEQGEDVLEPVVRDALRGLGANVEDPGQKGREDGRLVDHLGRRGMLEVKGRSGSLRLSDVRELDNWVREAIANEKWQGKGLLIVNLQCDEDPRKRKDCIPPNCVEAARTFDIAIITTAQLFHALVLNQKGALDREAFWNRLFSAGGLSDLPEGG